MGTVLVGFIVALIAMSLSGTMSQTAQDASENIYHIENGGYVNYPIDNSTLWVQTGNLPGQTGAPPLIELSGGLLWALVIVCIVLGIALGALKYTGIM
jgi:hypothetical protein